MRQILEGRRGAEACIETSRILNTSCAPSDWEYDLFRSCRTFDEVKAFATELELVAENDAGCIRLFTGEHELASFWLFD